MTNTKSFKEAILQAQELKRVSVEMAKDNLLESIAPKLQSMMTARLNEEADEELEEAINETEQEELDEDFDVSAFLQEDEDIEDEPSEEIPATDSEEAPSEEIPSDDEFGGEGEIEAGLPDETAISDLTVGDFKKLFQDIISGGTDDLGAADMDADVTGGDLDGIDAQGSEEFGGEGEEEEDEFNLDEILSEIENKLNPKKATQPVSKLQSQLNEATKTIKYLTDKITEVNLLNAKLIFANKLMKDISLSESQKMTVVSQIDKAKNPKEAKLIFESLKSTFIKTKPAKSKVQENLGFASAASGVAPTKPAGIITEDFNTRMKQLAGIIK